MQEKQKRNLEVNEQVFKTTKDSCNDLEDLIIQLPTKIVSKKFKLAT